MARLPKGARKLIAPVNAATAQARQALVRADILGLAATRSRLPDVTKGAFGQRSLRASGDMSGYLIGEPAVPKPPKPGKPPKKPGKKPGPKKPGQQRRQRLRRRAQRRLTPTIRPRG